MEEKNIWIGAGLAMLAFLVVTTPGWKEVLGVGSTSFGKYVPALILLGFMAVLVAIVFMGEGGEED